MDQKGRVRLLAMIVGAVIGALIGYSVGQSGWAALVGVGIGGGLLALPPLEFWVGLAKFGQIVALLPWVRLGEAVKMKEELEKRKRKQEN